MMLQVIMSLLWMAYSMTCFYYILETMDGGEEGNYRMSKRTIATYASCICFFMATTFFHQWYFFEVERNFE